MSDFKFIPVHPNAWTQVTDEFEMQHDASEARMVTVRPDGTIAFSTGFTVGWLIRPRVKSESGHD